MSASKEKSPLGAGNHRRNKSEMSSFIFRRSPPGSPLSELGVPADWLLTSATPGGKYSHAAPTQHVVFARFYRSLPLLQKVGRSRDGPMSGRGALPHAGPGIQFHRHPRETHVRQYAFALA